MDDKRLFKLMRGSVDSLAHAALHGVHAQEYADNCGFDIAKEHDFLITAINKLEDSDDGQTFEMMADVCSAIRDLADAYGGDKHFNNCVLMALRSCISALEGLNK